ncbi:hypothetical protein Sjap_020110 [Stephania japonica]|uniref:Uncharacterized protein n=1 Tax=Stephania japonica TaxID=461633 RepID=A0AAP0HZZ7_9MAGN
MEFEWRELPKEGGAAAMAPLKVGPYHRTPPPPYEGDGKGVRKLCRPWQLSDSQLASVLSYPTLLAMEVPVLPRMVVLGDDGDGGVVVPLLCQYKPWAWGLLVLGLSWVVGRRNRIGSSEGGDGDVLVTIVEDSRWGCTTEPHHHRMRENGGGGTQLTPPTMTARVKNCRCFLVPLASHYGRPSATAQGTPLPAMGKGESGRSPSP